MLVAIITDLHWGIRSDSAVFYRHFDRFYSQTFIPTIKEKGIKRVLMLGDTFDRRKYTNHLTLQESKRMLFDPLEDLGVHVDMLVGNHDTVYKNTNIVNSLNLHLSRYQNINLIGEAEEIDVDGTKILMLPWINQENKQQTLDLIAKSTAPLCMGHLEIAGFSMYKGQQSFGGEPSSIFDKFDMTFSGHYHHKSDNGSIYYLGSPYQMTWNDYGDIRGFHLFDTDTRQLTFIENPIQTFEKLDYDDSDNGNPQIIGDYRDKFVKVVVAHKTNPYKFDQFISKLYAQDCADIKIIEDLSEYSSSEIDDTIDLEDTVSLMDSYIDAAPITDVPTDGLKRYMHRLHTQALNQEVA